MDKEKEVSICSICYRDYKGWGNNAEPINSGRCCDKCNDLVIVARINMLTRKDNEQNNEKEV